MSEASSGEAAPQEQIRRILAEAGLTDEEAERESREIVEVARDRASEAAVRSWAARRAEGVPLGHLIGSQRFMGVRLQMDPEVLVPRPETELLGTTALSFLRSAAASSTPELRMIDMCCGAGNLACGLASALPDLRVWASDLSSACAGLARKNVEALNLGGRVQVEQGDLFEPLKNRGLEGTIDAVVCNPPYISSGRLAKDRAGLLKHEPREAFDGGPYGLSIHQRVISEAPTFLRPGGWLLFEFGAGQERQLKILFDRARTFDSIQFAHDPSGAPRVAYATKRTA